MKGIILAGGRATRLRPLTKITSKQLLPVYNKPMIYYPLETLLQAGIKEILIIVAPEYAGHFLHLLGSGKEFGAKFTYEIQETPRGLADAFIVGEDFLNNDSVAMILGDNIFEDNFTEALQSFKKGGRIFAKKVPDPERLGVVQFDEHKKVIQIVEKPQQWISDYAIPGLYIFDNRVSQFAKEVVPSARGEIEITELHKRYLELGELDVRVIEGKWFDAGTFDSLLEAGNYIAAREQQKADS
ncbi:MAG: NTP transferase domain-containing protein [Candidatus Kerfeldbacteria bacterium]|nr:NTP transferase domain-containing protein [Candidatus Kerfeldbacteria bacterium]